MIENSVSVVGILGPIVILAATLIHSRRAHAAGSRIGMVAAVAAFFIGVAGSYAAGTRVIGAVFGSEEIAQADVSAEWYRMWYPLAVGLAASVAISFLTCSRIVRDRRISSQSRAHSVTDG